MPEAQVGGHHCHRHGYLDLKACRRHGVPVANVPGYSTYSVAQMTFSLLLAICQCADRYHRLVQDGQWRTEEPAAYGLLPQVELLGKTFGIYGYGSIGRQTARIAKAFGMEVLVCTPHRSAGVRSRRCGIRGS